MGSGKRRRVHEQSSRWNRGLSILYLRVVTAVYRRSNEMNKHHSHPIAITWFSTCPSSHNSLYIWKARRHRGAWVSPRFTAFACLFPVITNMQPSWTLKNWHAWYFALRTDNSSCQREIYSQQRCQHPAASLAEYNGRQTHGLFHT